MKIKIALTIVCMVLIAVVYIVCQKTLGAYAEFNRLRLDPIGLNVYNRKFNFEDRRYEVVLLGDSHAENWKIVGKDVLNLGITSQTSNQIVLRSDILKDRIKGETLLIVVGANDILSLLTNKKEKKEIIARCLENIEHIVRNHESNFENIFIMTVPPFFKFPKKYLPFYDKSYIESMRRLNAGIYDVCKKKTKTIVLDAYNILKDNEKKVRVSTDGIHMNAQGYHYIDKLLAELLLESSY